MTTLEYQAGAYTEDGYRHLVIESRDGHAPFVLSGKPNDDTSTWEEMGRYTSKEAAMEALEAMTIEEPGKVTPDGLRVIRTKAEHGGYFITVFDKAAKSEHVLSFYDTPEAANWVYHELARRSECSGYTNWETFNIAVAMENDRQSYPGRMRLLKSITEADLSVTAADVRRWARRRGFIRTLQGLASENDTTWHVSLVDFADIASAWEVQRRELVEDGDL